MDLKQEGKKVVEKADAKLTSLTELVTRKGWTKWAVLGALAFVVVVVAFLLWPGKARATSYEHAVTAVVVKTVSPPTVVAAPAAAPAATPAPAPAQQPSGGGGGGSNVGLYVMGGVAIYMGAFIRSHWIFCAEDDRKSAKERKCYRPLRDGMP